MDTIALPKRHRESSIKPEDVQDALDTIAALPEDSREAVIVGRGFDTESAARNRARLLGAAMTEKSGGTLYSAHAVPDPDNEGKFIGAVSVRTNQEPSAPVERPEGAPTMRALQDAAKDHKLKGRSKMDYQELWDALTNEGVDPMSYGTGAASA